MSASASRAVSSSSAATAQTSSPTKRTSSRKITSSPRNGVFGVLKRCRTPRTPGSASARLVSMRRTRARHVVVRRLRDRAEQRDDRHDLPRGAEPALERVRVDERALDRMELAVLREPFDRLHAPVLARDRERQARIDRASVDEDGARAAGPLVAHLLRPREAELLAERVQERPPRGHVDDDALTVHLERDID